VKSRDAGTRGRKPRRGDRVTDREARIAYNESLFRQLNERLVEVLDELDDSANRMDIICECGRSDCAAKLTVAKDVYEGVRSHAERFLVCPGHVMPDVEVVVVARDGYEVVEKHDEEADIARATDPRA
jgi:hypothetical protein